MNCKNERWSFIGRIRNDCEIKQISENFQQGAPGTSHRKAQIQILIFLSLYSQVMCKYTGACMCLELLFGSVCIT